jgi:hypothetical protein
MVGEANEKLDMEILSKHADGSHEVSGGPAATGRLPFDVVPDREIFTVVADRDLCCLYLSLGQQAVATRQVVRDAAQPRNVKLHPFKVQSQEVAINFDSVRQFGREIVLEIAQPATEPTSLLLGVDSGKCLLSQHLSVNRCARARGRMREQKEPNEAEGRGSQQPRRQIFAGIGQLQGPKGANRQGARRWLR